MNTFLATALSKTNTLFRAFKKQNYVYAIMQQAFLKSPSLHTIISPRFSFSTKQNEETKTPGEQRKTNEQKENKTKPEEFVNKQKYYELKSLCSEIGQKSEKVSRKIDELRKLYQSNQSETEQIKVRYSKEINSMKLYAISNFAKDILEVQDNFHRAVSIFEDKELKKLPKDERNQLFTSFIEGIQIVESSLANTLRKHGVVEYRPLKEKYDPQKHEIVYEYMSDEGPSGTVCQVWEPGLRIGKNVLRPAKVGVYKEKKK